MEPGSADVRVAFHAPSPVVLVAASLAESDADGTSGPVWWRCAVVEDADRAADEVGVVVGAGDPERLGEAGWSGAELAVGAGGPSTSAHDLEASQGRAGAEEDGAGDPVGAAHHVRAPVHAVGEVDVEPAGRSEHGLVAGGGSPEGVAGGVFGAGVRLDLNDAGRDAVGASAVDEHLVQEQRGELATVAGVEAARQGARPHWSSQACCCSSWRWAASSCARTGPGPAPPAVVRCWTAWPGSRSGSAPARRGSRATRSARGTPSSWARRTRAPTAAWASRNGTPSRTRCSARSVAAASDWSAAACVRSAGNSAVARSPVRAGRASVQVSRESKRGSLSSWRSRL